MIRLVTPIVWFLLAALLAGEARATKPAVRPTKLPDRLHLVYTLTPAGPGSAAGERANRLEIVFESGRGRLTVGVFVRGQRKETRIDPWPVDALSALWGKIEESGLFRFQPRQGPMTPDFGTVALACEARFGRLALRADLKWTSPLANDGPIWPLLDHLDRLMNPAPSGPRPPVQPHQSGVIQIDRPSPGSPAAAPAPGEIDMLIALEATHLPIDSDPVSMMLSQSARQGPLFEKQRPKIALAIDVLSGRIRKNPGDTESLGLRGAFYYDLGDYRKAAGDFSRTIRLQPHQADHYNNRGMAHYRLGLAKEALADLGEATRRNRTKFAHLSRLIAGLRGR